jgi:CRP-like cAMP-binding protein
MQVTPNGQQLTLRIITPGQAFGGIALLQPAGGYPTTAIAVEDSTAKAWDTDFLRHLAEREPSLPMNVMELMHSYITDLQERHQAMVEQRVEQRIARVLIKLAAQTGIKTTEGVLINIRITRQDIAEMGGTTLFSVSRTLNEWERNGLVRIGRERVLIRDPHKLVMILENHL